MPGRFSVDLTEMPEPSGCDAGAFTSAAAPSWETGVYATVPACAVGTATAAKARPRAILLRRRFLRLMVFLLPPLVPRRPQQSLPEVTRTPRGTHARPSAGNGVGSGRVAMDYRILGPLEALDGERQLTLGGARQR